MEQRELRKEIFKILFEYEMMSINTEDRMQEFCNNNKLSASKQNFFITYIQNYIKHEQENIENIKKYLKSWTFERLGTVERVLLKMSFYEIVINDIGHEIVINETIELAKLYGDKGTSKFINGILADLIKNRGVGI